MEQNYVNVTLCIVITVAVSVCLFVTIAARTSQKPHVQSSPKFHNFPVHVARSSADDNSIRFVLPICG